MSIAKGWTCIHPFFFLPCISEHFPDNAPRELTELPAQFSSISAKNSIGKKAYGHTRPLREEDATPGPSGKNQRSFDRKIFERAFKREVKPKSIRVLPDSKFRQLIFRNFIIKSRSNQFIDTAMKGGRESLCIREQTCNRELRKLMME